MQKVKNYFSSNACFMDAFGKSACSDEIIGVSLSTNYCDYLVNKLTGNKITIKKCIFSDKVRLYTNYNV